MEVEVVLARLPDFGDSMVVHYVDVKDVLGKPLVEE
jgi:hypothetical protein